MLNSGDFNNLVCASNKKILALGSEYSLYFFDLKTGVRIPGKDTLDFALGGFNRHNSTFWGVNRFQFPDIKLMATKFMGFDTTQDKKLKSISELIDKRMKSMVKKIADKSQITPTPSAMNILNSLKIGKSSYAANQEALKNSKEVERCQNTLPILSILLKGCNTLEENIKEYEKLDKNDKNGKLCARANIFEIEHSIKISRDYFVELEQSILHQLPLIDRDLSEDNILDQYEFMVLISLLNGALKSIEILDISLSNVLQENEEYSTFMQTLNKTMKVISEITENIDSLRSDEMISIWKEVEKYSKSLNFIILNLSSDSNTEIVNKINEMIEDLSNDKVKVAHSVFLKYLSMSTTLDSI
jgi:hypothetical protein